MRWTDASSLVAAGLLALGAQESLPSADAVLTELKAGNAHHIAKKYQHPHQTAARQHALASSQKPSLRDPGVCRLARAAGDRLRRGPGRHLRRPRGRQRRGRRRDGQPRIRGRAPARAADRRDGAHALRRDLRGARRRHAPGQAAGSDGGDSVPRWISRRTSPAIASTTPSATTSCTSWNSSVLRSRCSRNSSRRASCASSARSTRSRRARWNGCRLGAAGNGRCSESRRSLPFTQANQRDRWACNSACQLRITPTLVRALSSRGWRMRKRWPSALTAY